MRELIQAVLKTGGASVAILFFNAITVKILAAVAGPVGVGAWSLLRQCQQTAVIVGTGNGGTSFVRGVSRLTGNEKLEFMRTVAVTYLILGAIVTIVLVLGAGMLEHWVGSLGAGVFALLALPVLISIARDYLIAVLNGLHRLGTLALVQILGAAAGALAAYPISVMVSKGGYSGLVLLMFIVSIVTLLAAAHSLRNSGLTVRTPGLQNWNMTSFRKFASLAGVMAITGTVGTISMFAVRTMIARSQGVAAAGYFDVSWSLCLMYLGFLLNAFGTYYLPKLSAMADHDQGGLIRNVAKLTVMATTPAIVIVTVVKPWVIDLLYSPDFYPSLGIFQWMLIADYLKMSTWVFSIVVVARGLEKPLLLGSVAWDLGLVAGVWVVLHYDMPLGAIGFVIVLLHLASLAGYYQLISRSVKPGIPMRLFATWIAGLICVLVTAATCWDSIRINFGAACLPVAASLLISYSTLSRQDIAGVRKFFAELRKDR